MAKTKTVKLSQPVVMHGKSISEIVLKEPTGGNYLDFGDPYIAVNSAGGLFYAEDKAVIGNYLDACVQHDNGSDVLRLLLLADAQAVKKALLGFFSDSAPETSDS